MGRFPEKRRVFSRDGMIYLEIRRAVPQNIGLKKGIEDHPDPRKWENFGFSSPYDFVLSAIPGRHTVPGPRNLTCNLN